MLRFLSRDASNAQRIADLKRKADASALTLKAKRVLSDKKSHAETKSAPVVVLASAVPINNVNKRKGRKCCAFVHEKNFTPSFQAWAVMEQLRRDIEIKFGEKQSASI